MPKPAIAIRLGTEGAADTRRDIETIGTANEAAANRARAAWQRASTDVEAAQRRQAAAAAKIAAIMPQSSTQMRISDSVGTGFGQFEGSAKISAAAFRDLIAEQERYEQSASRLRAALDPSVAAQQRFNAEMAEARTLVAAGAISLDEYSKKLWQEQQALKATSVEHGRVGASSAAMKAGFQQAGFQVQDFLVQVNGGTSAIKAFSMQAPQMIGSLQLMANGAEKSTGKFASFLNLLSGGWGVALGIAIPAGAMLIDHLISMGDSADSTTGKLDRQADVVDRLAGAYDNLAASMNKAGAKSVEALGIAEVKLRADEANIGKLRKAADDAATRLAASQRVDPKGQGSAPLIRDAAEARAELEYAERQLQINRNLVSETRKRWELAEKAKVADAAPKSRSGGRTRSTRTPQGEGESLEMSIEKRRSDWLNDQDIGAGARAMLEAEGNALVEKQNIIRSINQDVSGGLALLSVEWELRGKSRDVVQDALELERYRQSIISRLPELTKAEVDEKVKAKQAQVELNRLIEENAANWEELRNVGSEAIDRLFDPASAESWGARVKGIFADLQQELIKLAVLNPLKNLLSGKTGGDALPTIGSVLGLFGKKPGHNAVGTEYWSGGMTYVGEHGRELVDLPRGSKVYNARDTRQMMGGGGAAVKVEVVKGDLFDVRVTEISAQVSARQIGSVAPTIVAGSSQGTQVAMQRQARRRLA